MSKAELRAQVLQTLNQAGRAWDSANQAAIAAITITEAFLEDDANAAKAMLSVLPDSYREEPGEPN